MTWYDTNSCDFSDFFTTTVCANQLANGLLMPLILFAVFIILLIGTIFNNRSFFRGLTISGFTSSILAIVMVIMNVLNTNYMYLCFFVTGMGLVGVILSEAMS